MAYRCKGLSKVLTHCIKCLLCPLPRTITAYRQKPGPCGAQLCGAVWRSVYLSDCRNTAMSRACDAAFLYPLQALLVHLNGWGAGPGPSTKRILSTTHVKASGKTGGGEKIQNRYFPRWWVGVEDGRKKKKKEKHKTKWSERLSDKERHTVRAVLESLSVSNVPGVCSRTRGESRSMACFNNIRNGCQIKIYHSRVKDL